MDERQFVFTLVFVDLVGIVRTAVHARVLVVARVEFRAVQFPVFAVRVLTGFARGRLFVLLLLFEQLVHASTVFEHRLHQCFAQLHIVREVAHTVQHGPLFEFERVQLGGRGKVLGRDSAAQFENVRQYGAAHTHHFTRDVFEYGQRLDGRGVRVVARVHGRVRFLCTEYQQVLQVHSHAGGPLGKRCLPITRSRVRVLLFYFHFHRVSIGQHVFRLFHDCVFGQEFGQNLGLCVAECENSKETRTSRRILIV